MNFAAASAVAAASAAAAAAAAQLLLVDLEKREIGKLLFSSEFRTKSAIDRSMLLLLLSQVSKNKILSAILAH